MRLVDVGLFPALFSTTRRCPFRRGPCPWARRLSACPSFVPRPSLQRRVGAGVSSRPGRLFVRCCCLLLTEPPPSVLVQGGHLQGSEVLDGEGMHGTGVRSTTDIRVQRQQEAGLLRSTPVNTWNDSGETGGSERERGGGATAIGRSHFHTRSTLPPVRFPWVLPRNDCILPVCSKLFACAPSMSALVGRIWAR